MAERSCNNHLFYGQTTSLCEQCLQLVPTKILIEDDAVWYLKRCAEHGTHKTLIATDVAYYRHTHDYLKAGERPHSRQTLTERGCPWDCGLCPDHEQHSCVGIVEITEQCNLRCPVCFADSAPGHGSHRTLAQVEFMLDALVASEGTPDVVQISGGEPSIHPDILAILRMARAKPIKHLMLNTNGVRLAREPDFVAALSEFTPGFEVYLQFDALDDGALQDIRGADLAATRLQALQHLEAHGISTTLVVTVKGGVNDSGLWRIVETALRYRCVRGVTFQPVQDAGRNPHFDKQRHRSLLTDIRRQLITDSGVFGEDDLLPLPCNPEYIAIGYALRNGQTLTPITRFIPKQEFIGAAPASIAFERDPQLKQRLFEVLSLSGGALNTGERLQQLLCCLPELPTPAELRYEHVFRITIVQFMDRFNFCVGGVKRSCIHIVHGDGRIIPFDTYNLFYRDLPAGADPRSRVGNQARGAIIKEAKP
jgi:uncharacterized radical SAM superfamily Fe-S cluster-containing enzyme